MNTDIFQPRFQKEDKAREHLERIRWAGVPFCPHCGSFDVTRLEGKKHRKGLLQCNEKECRKQFSVTVGTLFERSKIPLHKWLLVNHLLCSSKKGMSAHQVHRMVGVTYKTAWFMCHRIRESMKQDNGPLGGPGKIVEADEAFVGGKAKNRAFRPAAPKKAIVTLVERDGRARTFHVANVHAGTLRSVLTQNVDRASTLSTDKWRHYGPVGREFKMHGWVDHSKNQYARTVTFDRISHKVTARWHSNTVENFFSIFKRGVIGTYHHLSEAHLHRYCGEFDFRYNTREITDAERGDLALAGIYGKRLTYRRPRSLAA